MVYISFIIIYYLLFLFDFFQIYLTHVVINIIIIGQLSSAIGSLTQLVTLDVSLNKFSGKWNLIIIIYIQSVY